MRTMKFTRSSFEERLAEVIYSTPQNDSQIEEMVEELSGIPLLEAPLVDQQVLLPAPVSEDEIVHTNDVLATVGSELAISKEIRADDPGKKRQKKKDHGESVKRHKVAGDQSSKGKEVATTLALPLLEENVPLSPPMVDETVFF